MTDGQMQKTEGIKHRLPLLNDCLDQSIHRRGCRPSAADMPAHPVHDDQAGHFADTENLRAILIFGPVPNQAEMRMINKQSVFPDPAYAPDC
jgi:hypothetical protein